MGDFFPLDSHLMVYFIIWEMHGFPHQFPIEWENVNRIEIVTHNFPIVWVFFPIRFTSYGILHLMGNAYDFLSVSHNIGKGSQTHQMGKDWEIGSQ